MGEVFEHPVRVRWSDCDALGHVNNAVFLTYLEEGRDAFYSEVVGERIYVVARIEIDFLAEVPVDDASVTVRVAVEQVGTTSLRTRETVIRPAGEVAAEARVVTVHWDLATRQPAPFGRERDRLAAMAGGAADPE